MERASSTDAKTTRLSGRMAAMGAADATMRVLVRPS
jgi:hypothetical protein